MIPESWDRDLKSYQRAGTRKCKASPETRRHGKTQQAQHDRFEQRRREDEAYWRGLMGGAA